MATLVKRPNGRKSIQFTGPSGKRKELRLGVSSLKQGETVLSKVDAILSDLAMGRPHDVEVADWIKSLPPKFMGRMQRLGLIPFGVNRQVSTLGDFLAAFFAAARVKPSTETMYSHTKRNLLAHFGPGRQLRSIGVEDAEKFRQYLAELAHGRRQGKLASSTINRRVRVARSIFALALKWKRVDENPFASVKAGEQVNKARQYFITREETASLLKACPDAQWRLLISLARFGGLRCPSEIIPMKWDDIDWERKRIVVHSPKTEHHEGQGQRIIPMFPELEKSLLEVFEEAEEGNPWVISRYRVSGVNLRTHLVRIMKRAGLKPWPKLWQNMRATRETELAETEPMYVVCAWIGNSQRVAAAHYLQVTGQHFDRAVNPPQIPPQQTAETVENGGKAKESAKLNLDINACGFSWLSAEGCQFIYPNKNLMGPAGLEPASVSLKGSHSSH